MRFMVMHGVDKDMESGAPAAQEIIRNMGKLIGRHIQAGTFVDGAGLREQGADRRLLEMPTLDDAKAFTIDYAQILGDNQVDIRVVA